MRLPSRQRTSWHALHGLTSSLVGRIWQHRNHAVPGFSSKYRVDSLVWYEQHPTMYSAIAREKAIKSWKRLWKIELIESLNPEWRDLYPNIIDR